MFFRLNVRHDFACQQYSKLFLGNEELSYNTIKNPEKLILTAQCETSHVQSS